MASVRTPATGGSAARAPQTPALAAEVEALDRESLASLAAARRAVARLSTENGQLREALAAAQRDADRAALSDERLRAARARDEATLERWRQEIEGARDRDRRDATERGREATRVRAAFRARLERAEAERDAMKADLDEARAAAAARDSLARQEAARRDRAWRHERARHVRRQDQPVAADPVHAEAHDHLGLAGLDVNVTRALGVGLADQLTRQADHRRRVLGDVADLRPLGVRGALGLAQGLGEAGQLVGRHVGLLHVVGHGPLDDRGITSGF